MFGFARQQWHYGYFQDARGNLEKAVDLMIAARDRTEHARYIALWYAITADRLGALDRAKLQKAAEFLSSSQWPMPLLDFYLGERKIEQVVARAERGDSDAIPGQKCEANFYLAEWKIAHGDADVAKLLLASALTGCPAGFIELQGAKAEAKRQGMKEDGK
jgi:lipoprotein NlpI